MLCARHQFDYLSGWCRTCGQVRDDGAEMSYAGRPRRPGPDYSPDDLAALTNRAETILARRRRQ